jgi:hypothetical protein
MWIMHAHSTGWQAHQANDKLAGGQRGEREGTQQLEGILARKGLQQQDAGEGGCAEDEGRVLQQLLTSLQAADGGLVHC